MWKSIYKRRQFTLSFNNPGNRTRIHLGDGNSNRRAAEEEIEKWSLTWIQLYICYPPRYIALKKQVDYVISVKRWVER